MIASRNDDPPQLIEALLFEPQNGYFLLQEHLERLANSAAELGYPCSVETLVDALHSHGRSLRRVTKVRVELSADGDLRIESARVRPSTPLRCAPVPLTVPSDYLYLRHKTTRRDHYRVALESRPGYDEVILYNEHDELTETTAGNLVVKLDGEALTPELSAGLLPGTYRRHLLARGELREARLTREDLWRASELWMINSIRRHCPLLLD